MLKVARKLLFQSTTSWFVYFLFLCVCVVAVCTKEEVGSTDGLCIDPVDLNSFFDDEDGKIYGYQGLKVNTWICNLECIF